MRKFMFYPTFSFIQASISHSLFYKYVLRNYYWPAMWLTPIIPALWETEAGGSPEVRSSRSPRPTWQNPVSTKNTKISQPWCCTPVISAIQEAEAGESLEHRRWRLQWAKIMPLHSSLGNRVRLCLKKKRKKKDSGLGVQAWWFMPVISAHWEAKVGRSLEVKSSRSAWSTWWNPVSTKNIKN